MTERTYESMTGPEMDEALEEHLEALAQLAGTARFSRSDLAKARSEVRMLSDVSVKMTHLAFEIIQNDGNPCRCPVCVLALAATEEMIGQAERQNAFLDKLTLKQREVFVAVGIHTSLAANLRTQIDHIFTIIKAAHEAYENIQSGELRKALDEDHSPFYNTSMDQDDPRNKPN